MAGAGFISAKLWRTAMASSSNAVKNVAAPARASAGATRAVPRPYASALTTAAQAPLVCAARVR